MVTSLFKSTQKKLENININFWDIISILIIFTIFILLAKAATGMATPYQLGEKLVINLDTNHLPYYALRSVLRMAIALMISLVFSLIIGYASGKSKKAEMIFIPLIDILQSVPILGFLSISVLGFIALFPNSLLGPECAAIFAIITSQAWNMTLSVYQSIKLLPTDYDDVGRAMNLNSWQRFWRIELPYATPGLLWNMMISLSGGWFFVVASEAISVNNQNIYLPGIGSYIQVAINTSNLSAIFYAILAMLIIIFIYDQIIFRPLLKVATNYQDLEDSDDNIENTEDLDKNIDKNIEQKINQNKDKHTQYNSWVYNILQKTILVKKIIIIKDYFADFWINKLAISYNNFTNRTKNIIHFNYNINLKNYTKFPLFEQTSKLKLKSDGLVYKILENIKNISLFSFTTLVVIFVILYKLFDFISAEIHLNEIFYVIRLGFITGFKIFILVILCSLLWLPIGVYIGSRPGLSKYMQPVIQFVAAFPANLIYPLLVVLIIKYNLNIEIWTAPLLIIGTQWYILFNIIAGMNNIPKDLKDAVKSLQVKKSLWWRKFMLPAIFPYYITGAMTAAGGAWNASIVAESISWGHKQFNATGLGSYIVSATSAGDFARVALGITIMSLFVTLLNKILWQKLYDLAASRYQMDG